MGQHNFKWRWAHVDESGRTQNYVDLLNSLRVDDEPATFPRTLAWIDAQPGERILEIGCGNGAVARAVARQTPVGELVAIDASAAMIAEARQRGERIDLPVNFVVADAHRLPFPDASFDRAYVMETLVIVPDPDQVLAEMARVLRPGGELRVWESDVDSHAMLTNDVELGRRFMRYVGDCLYNGAAGRKTVGWLRERSWAVSFEATVGVSEGGGAIGQWLLDEWLADAAKEGALSSEEAESLACDVCQRHESGTFLSYLVSFRIAAAKPA